MPLTETIAAATSCPPKPQEGTIFSLTSDRAAAVVGTAVRLCVVHRDGTAVISAIPASVTSAPGWAREVSSDVPIPQGCSASPGADVTYLDVRGLWFEMRVVNCR